MPPRGVSELIVGADGLGFSATDGGLSPPPPISVEPSGIPTGPTEEPAPIDDANGGDAVVDAAQIPGALAVMPPPSKGEEPDNPIELPAAGSAPVVGLPAAGEVPLPADAPLDQLSLKADAGAVGTPAPNAPNQSEAPAGGGLPPPRARSVPPTGISLVPAPPLV